MEKIAGIFKRRYSTNDLVDGNIRLDKVGRHLYVDGKEISVTAKELDLLLYMMENKGKVLPKEELFNKIWGFDSESEPQTVTVHIKWLREKLESVSESWSLKTVWGVGYKFEVTQP